jgi:Lipocalin-like domain
LLLYSPPPRGIVAQATVPFILAVKCILSPMKRLATLLLILICLTSAPAAPQQDDFAMRFVGAWRLVSIEGVPPGLPGNLYDRPTGQIIYSASGRVSAQLVAKADRKPFAAFNKGRLSATTEDKAAAFDSYQAYYGTYTVDAKAGTVTHHLEGSLIPGREGINNVRWFEFRGDDRFLLIPVEDGKGGVLARKDAVYKLLWERLK